MAVPGPGKNDGAAAAVLQARRTRTWTRGVRQPGEHQPCWLRGYCRADRARYRGVFAMRYLVVTAAFLPLPVFVWGPHRCGPRPVSISSRLYFSGIAGSSRPSGARSGELAWKQRSQLRTRRLWWLDRSVGRGPRRKSCWRWRRHRGRVEEPSVIDGWMSLPAVATLGERAWPAHRRRVTMYLGHGRAVDCSCRLLCQDG